MGFYYGKTASEGIASSVGRCQRFCLHSSVALYRSFVPVLPLLNLTEVYMFCETSPYSHDPQTVYVIVATSKNFLRKIHLLPRTLNLNPSTKDLQSVRPPI